MLKLKKSFVTMLAVMLALVTFVTGAYAASTTKSFTYNSSIYGGLDGTLTTNEDYYNVYATVDIGYGPSSPDQAATDYVTFYLQRYEGGSWTTIDTKSSVYVASDKNANATFSNISNVKDMSTRVKIYFSGSKQTIYSNTWTR